MSSVIIIGSGFAGLSAAAHLARRGYEVTIVEKNSTAGGRARKFEEQGFVFDMGPSWYWMPEVFEQHFAHFGKSVSDYYDLVRLDPAYQIFFGQHDTLKVPASMAALRQLFEQTEAGSSTHLDRFLAEAEYKYKVGMGEFVHKPSLSLREFADMRIAKSLFQLDMLSSVATQVHRLFKNERLRQLLTFPVLFLGATPEKTPALYTMMNYADLVLGTWYPQGGMHRIVEGMLAVALAQGATIQYHTTVQQIVVERGNARRVITDKGDYAADIVVGAADYHHVEQRLLPSAHRDYTPQYWEKRAMAPSSLLFYLGINKRVEGLLHHNLFFDEDFNQHAKEIYETPRLPQKPLFYVSAPSKTDPSVAPPGCENLFLLIPLAPGISVSAQEAQAYLMKTLQRLEQLTGQSVIPHIMYQKAYTPGDFVTDYNAFKGNAYGLANTLLQTAFLKPRMKSKKVNNLYYTGQLTVPGPGVPPSIISGKVVADLIVKDNPLKIVA